MRKWNPVYRVTVYTKNETVTIKLPLTCKMTITRSILTQNTSANIELYNLSYETRKFIDQPPYQALTDNAKYVIVEAGYGDENSMYMIFKGYILEAFSSKQGGETDIITNIQAQALDLLISYSSYQFEAGTSNREIFKTLASDLINCSIANVGAIEGEIRTATTFEGNTLEQLNKVTGGNTFIDNGQINCILSNEVIDVPVPVITDSNALLQTPKRSAANLTVKMLFEPSLIVGQLLEIHSGIEPDFDGQYKVLGFTHDLYFSASTDGQRTTTAELWYTKNLQNSPIYVSGDKTQETVNKVKNETVLPVETSKVNTDWGFPLKSMQIRSNYGYRIHPIYKDKRFHDGIDLTAKMNTPVFAVADGKAEYVGLNGTLTSGYGKYIRIDHGNELKSFYGHLNSFSITQGQKVTKGQQIALSGNTGGSTGPHLHFGARKGNNKENPLKYLPKF